MRKGVYYTMRKITILKVIPNKIGVDRQNEGDFKIQTRLIISGDFNISLILKLKLRLRDFK